MGAPMQPNKVITFPLTEQHQRQIDELFRAPSAVDRYDLLQLQESQQSDDLADCIARIVHGLDDVEQIEDRRQRANCRFLATQAVRLSQDCWSQAATDRAIQKCEEWMKTEGGDTFTGCSDELLHALAVNLAPRIVWAWRQMAEGSCALPPGEYLRIAGKK